MDTSSFADRDGFIWLNGKLVPWRDANIHVLTHGLHYASSVFEGERVYDGEIFKLQEHTDRLIESARILGLRMKLTRPAARRLPRTRLLMAMSVRSPGAVRK